MIPASVVRQAADGSCTGAAVDLTAASMYHIAINDFMAAGGDGYPNVASRAHSREIMDQTVADWITANSPLSPDDPGPDRLRRGGLPADHSSIGRIRATEPLSRSR